MTEQRGLNYCLICGRKFTDRGIEIHSHLGITTSNSVDDIRDSDGSLIFSREGMMGQLRQMGYLA